MMPVVRTGIYNYKNSLEAPSNCHLQGGIAMHYWLKKANLILLGITVLIFAASCATTGSTSQRSDEAQGLVDKAKATFRDFMSDQQYTWFHSHLSNARGLLIFPQIIKGGFFIGGSGGTGVLVVKRPGTPDWSQPAFYTIGSATFGLQIGGEAAEVIVMAMSQRAVDSLLSSSVNLGGDTSVALGPIGIGAKGNITADFISFAKSKGLYAGINLEGSVLDVRDSLNSAYYGRSVSPVNILIERTVSNEGSAQLRDALMQAVK